MKIEEAILFFEGLKTMNSSKKELKTYTSFIAVLTDIKSRAISDEDFLAIETELTALKIKENANDAKILGKKKCNFIAFVKKKLSLISEGQHMSNGMALGMSIGLSLGMSIGIAFGKNNGMALGMNFGMLIGMGIGMAIGTAKDKEAKKAGNVLSTKG
ncbi:hypothetical protein [Lacinutrix sp. Bg11-31]|uniref:hypothetical protein n=1 Tax=Lacinutrix sp. Bg11-31 TaxID=2057808 RepID=UPI000C30ACD3|nr:hypothetical protein [Lacinutrix sp. Bg11-31]AUC80938.1 hypothetical protein CW733_01830 [Lacinutrix sp. Bg11-31]